MKYLSIAAILFSPLAHANLRHVSCSVTVPTKQADVEMPAVDVPLEAMNDKQQGANFSLPLDIEGKKKQDFNLIAYAQAPTLELSTKLKGLGIRVSGENAVNLELTGATATESQAKVSCSLKK